MASKKNNNSLQAFVGISVGVFLFSVLVYSFLGSQRTALTQHDNSFAAAACDISLISNITISGNSAVKCSLPNVYLYSNDQRFTLFKLPPSLNPPQLSFISTGNTDLLDNQSLSWSANFSGAGSVYVFYRKIPGLTAPTWLSSYTKQTPESFDDINQFFLRKNDQGLIGVYDIYKKTIPSSQQVTFGAPYSSTGRAYSMYLVGFLPDNAPTSSGVATASPVSTPVTTPNGSPEITPAPGGAFKIVEADPAVTTSNTVNSFIKNIVKSGVKKVAASGAWWGPTTQFFKNQEWVVVKNIDVGHVYPAGSSITVNFTCLHPGAGTPNNGLTLPTLRFQLGHNDAAYIRGNPLGNFVSSSLSAPSSGSDELRTVCLTKEGTGNLFGDGSPKVGDELHTNLDQSVWFGSKGTPGTGTGNHLGLPAKYDLLDSHSWYSGIEYAYGAIDGGHDDGTGDMSTNDLVGATVKGNLTVYGFAFKRTNENTVKVHHVELRIEQNDEDYTVVGELSQPTGAALTAQKRRFAYTLDTTKLADGWHILSWHMHVINEAFSAQHIGHQLAGEIKIPICVKNTATGSCP